MRTQNPLKKLNRKAQILWSLCMVLLLAVLVSAAVLFSKLNPFAKKDPVTDISLSGSTETGTGESEKQTGGRNSDGAGESEDSGSEEGDGESSGTESGGMDIADTTTAESGGQDTSLQQNASGLTPGFEASDDNTVWNTQTQVEIFRISYENGENEVTVVGDGDKLLAPGTANTYSFRLTNTGNVAVDYTMTMEAWFSHGDMTIPVEVRLSDYQGRYLAGSENAWDPVMELNDVSDAGVLGADCYAGYTLTWQWPFEGDDVYDTFLGNSAVDEDITLTIEIRTTAEADADPNASGGIPKTGDVPVAFLISLMLIAFFLLLLALLVRTHRKEA